MPFCVNCGHNAGDEVALCPKCFRDPAVPHSQWSKQLQWITDNPGDDQFHDFTYKGEKVALITAIFISFFAIITVSVISLGLIPLSFVVMFFVIRFRWIRTRAAMMPISDDSYPNICRMAEVAAGRLRIPVPRMFVEQSPVLNAYTTGMFNDNWIVIHSALIESLSDDELMTVIGHEMGHIKLRHVTWMIFAGTGEQTVSIPWVSFLLGPIFNTWHHRSEFSADRAGLISSGSVDACVRSEVKLLTGKSLPEDFNLDAYVKNVMNEKDTVAETVTQLLFDTHPFARKRIRQIVNYSETDEFKTIWHKYSKPDPAVAGQ